MEQNVKIDSKGLDETVIGLDKSGYKVNIFLISPQKHMLWVLVRSASVDKSGYKVNIFLISPQKHMLWVLVRSASVTRFC